MRSLKRQNSGFTIIELLIATAVFSTILLLCAFALLQIGRTYYKGVTSNKTQEASRSIIDEISRAVQFSGDDPVTSVTETSGSKGFCLSGKLFSYKLDQQVTDGAPDPDQNKGNHALLVSPAGACSGSTAALNVDGPTGEYRELLPEHMRLNKLSITQVGTSKLYTITIRVVYGDNDVLNDAHDTCQEVRVGTQFCAVSELTTTVQKRI